MYKRIKSSINLSIILYIVTIATIACTQNSNPNTMTVDVTATALTPAIPSSTSTPSQKTEQPVYTLKAELPDSPSQLRIYKQVPLTRELPDEERLKTIMKQLQISGTVTRDDRHVEVTWNPGYVFSLSSYDPFILYIQNGSIEPSKLSLDVRIQTAETFLKAGGLLDFPYLMEPPRSRQRDYAIRVAPLIDGYPLYDYNALNGRLLIIFDSAGQVDRVTWRALKIAPVDVVDVVPAAVAWEQLVKGEFPMGNAIGQCWEGDVLDPITGKVTYIRSNSKAQCSHYGGTPTHYTAATINEVKIVYFAYDIGLNGGVSLFGCPEDFPDLNVFPMWQFSGTTSDGRDLIIIWPAIPAS